MSENEIHPENLQQDEPQSLIYIFSSVFALISSYGWFILLGICVSLYAWKRLQPKWEQWQESAEYHKNPDKFIERENSVSAARQRMQEQYEELLKKKIKEKENEPAPSNNLPEPRTTSKPIERKRKPLREGFNPMMSDTRSCGWRPGGRRSGGG